MKNLASSVFLTALAGGYLFCFLTGKLYEPSLLILYSEVVALVSLMYLGVITAWEAWKSL